VARCFSVPKTNPSLPRSRSRSPTNERGKQNSARNSTRHGLLAGTVVLREESADRFLTLLAAYTGEYQPTTASQVSLVETMAVARWRQLRVWGAQKTAMDRDMALQDPNVGPACVRALLAPGRDFSNQISLAPQDEHRSEHANGEYQRGHFLPAVNYAGKFGYASLDHVDPRGSCFSHMPRTCSGVLNRLEFGGSGQPRFRLHRSFVLTRSQSHRQPSGRPISRLNRRDLPETRSCHVSDSM
jgi:hypothetical protein